MEWKDSVTRENLLRACAGESQARNRYTFAAATAKKKGLHLIEAVFLYTADQERAHAKVFYTHLQEGGCDSGLIAGAHYPVDLTEDVAELLDLAQTHETEEWDSVYPSFARKAEEEGFEAVARHFRQIADVDTAGGAAAHHQHRRVLHPSLGGDELRLREKAADALDQGHPVIPGITAAAVADADLPSIRHGASSGWSVPRPAAPG